MIDLSGDWQSYYRYTSSTRGGADFWGQYTMHATQDGDTVKFETGPESAAHGVIELKLGKNGQLATGKWREKTDPSGAFKGKEFNGIIEFRIVENGNRLNGVWHGIGGSGAMHTDIWELVRAREDDANSELPQRWNVTHWYPNKDDSAEESVMHEMKGYWDDGTLVLESLPLEDGSYLFVRLHIQDGIATGNWYESAAMTGDFEGAQYSGAGQLMVDKDTFHMEGKWAGAGLDRKENKMKIYTGRWEIAPLGDNE